MLKNWLVPTMTEMCLHDTRFGIFAASCDGYANEENTEL